MTDLVFTSLERAALRDLCLRFPADRPALEMQLATAQVQSRKNTGAGFYTNFDVDRSKSPALTGDRLRSGGWVRVDGFKEPMGFILWLQGGYAECLEGFTVDDSTVSVDLMTLTFILPMEPILN